MMRMRIWCETVAMETAASRAVTTLLSRYGVDPILAVQPGGEGELPLALTRLRTEGLRPALWPMLDDARGRWGSAWNAPAFAAWVKQAVGACGSAGRGLEVVFDLEPPIALLASALTYAGRRRSANLAPGANLSRTTTKEALDTIGSAVSQLQSEGYRALAAVAPLVLLDPSPTVAFEPLGRTGMWQAWLGTPVDGIAWDGVQVMAYSSIVRGWSRGLLDRRASIALLRRSSEAAVQRYGPRAGVSLGAMGVGAFGDEPVFTSPYELAQDVAHARAAGVNDLALFELGGVLARPAPELWLEAFCAPSLAVIPKRSLRAMALWSIGKIASRAARRWLSVPHRAR